MDGEIPLRMRAAQFDRYGSPDVIRVRLVPTPHPGPGQVLVRVSGASVNRGEFVLLHGGARLLSGRRFPKGLGSDFSGVVADLGHGVTDVQVGQQVWGLVPGLRAVRSTSPTGTAAEYVVVERRDIHPLPPGIDLRDAAALPVVGPTALRAVRAASIRAGDRVLVRGAAGGVGTALLQLAHAARAHVTALVGGGSADFVRGLGADEVLDHRAVAPAQLAQFDVILDAVGTEMPRYRARLAPGGRMVAITASPLLSGLATIALSSIHRSRRIRFSQHDPDASDFHDLADAVTAGRLSPVVDTRFPLEQTREAYESLARGGINGKVLIHP